MTAKKMQSNVGASTQPCLTPMHMSKASDDEPSNWTTPFISIWNDWIALRSLSFCEVDKSDGERLPLFSAFLLQLSKREDHVDCGAF